jgi:hypothetical protein
MIFWLCLKVQMQWQKNGHIWFCKSKSHLHSQNAVNKVWQSRCRYLPCFKFSMLNIVKSFSMGEKGHKQNIWRDNSIYIKYLLIGIYSYNWIYGYTHTYKYMTAFPLLLFWMFHSVHGQDSTIRQVPSVLCPACSSERQYSSLHPVGAGSLRDRWVSTPSPTESTMNPAPWEGAVNLHSCTLRRRYRVT